MLRRRQVDIAATPEPFPVGHDVAVDAQPRHPAVRKNPETQVRGLRRPFDRDEVVRIAVERRAWKDLVPDGAHEILRGRQAREVAGVDAARLREVAFEMRGIDVHAADDAGRAQPHQAPVGAVDHPVATPAGFPPVHPLAPFRVLALSPLGHRRLDQVFFRREELVVGGDDGAAEPLRREVDEILECLGHKSWPPYARVSRFLSHTRSPRTNVVRTVPMSDRPA